MPYAHGATARGEGGEGEHRIRVMSPPSYVGEIGVLERIPRTATVTAATDMQVLRIEGTALVDALTSAPPSSSLMENAGSRLALTHPSRALTFPAPDARERV